MRKKEVLRRKTISALIYSFGGFIGKSAIEFIIGIVLARLLLPQDYGLLGMIMIFISISQNFVDSGMTTALVREKKVSNEDYSTVFYYNLFVAIVLYTLLYISATHISVFFREPLLVSIVRVAGLNLIISSFGLIQRTILVRTLNFRLQTLIELVASVVSGIIAVYFANMGYGVWALVIKMLLTQVIISFMFIAHNRWHPLRTFSLDSFKRLFGFGWKMLATGLLATLYQNIYNIIIGRNYLQIELGYYTKSKQFADLASNSMAMSVQRVSYPVLSKLQDDNVSLNSGFKRIIKHSSFVTFPMMIGLTVLSKSLIHVLLGENWLPMVPYFQILCISGMTLPHRAINSNVLQVKGRSDLFLKLDIINIIIGLCLVFIAIALKLGMNGLLGAIFITSQIAFFIKSFYSKQFISYSTKEQLKDMVLPLILTSFMGVIVYITGLLIPFSSVVKLLIQFFIGVFTYIGVSKLAKVEELNTFIQLIKSLHLRFLAKTK
ncbi:lipopolysaccharide biosynthesis protein [Sedimentibacter sp.]|uniref:lipopolysaccharide biosynthesis protein n=1 Tax=Sedimentibacter sp. TaxID=1960295 RepID=UPI0028ACE22D|nr:lipopolysaccharide biosynthesis protein [Sedimentibacter sp.]